MDCFLITVRARCLGFPGSILLSRAYMLSAPRECGSRSTQMVALFRLSACRQDRHPADRARIQM